MCILLEFLLKEFSISFLKKPEFNLFRSLLYEMTKTRWCIDITLHVIVKASFYFRPALSDISVRKKPLIKMKFLYHSFEFKFYITVVLSRSIIFLRKKSHSLKASSIRI